MTAQIILASASPRRRELLDQIKVAYRIHPVDLDEAPLPNETPLDYVQRLAAEKSAAYIEQLGDALPVLAADTAVVLGDVIMGKPKDRDDALAMLRQLSGKMHRVYSAISLRGREHSQAVSITEVTFRALTEAEIAANRPIKPAVMPFKAWAAYLSSRSAAVFPAWSGCHCLKLRNFYPGKASGCLNE
jgi:septum formation protein